MEASPTQATHEKNGVSVKEIPERQEGMNTKTGNNKKRWGRANLEKDKNVRVLSKKRKKMKIEN